MAHKNHKPGPPCKLNQRNSNERKRLHRVLVRNMKEPVVDGPIKLRLDARTVITVGSEKAVEYWRGRYPGLQRL